MIVNARHNTHHNSHVNSHANIGGGATIAKDISGAVAAWLMEEASGPIVDAVGSISVANDGSTGPYGVAGGIYTPGISFDGSSGFHRSGGVSSMNISAGESINLFSALKRTAGSKATILATTNSGTGNPGYEFYMNNTSVICEVVCTDTTYSNAMQWSSAENAGVASLYDGLLHTIELRVNRAIDKANLYVDDMICTIQDIDISAIHGKAIAATGVGIGCDYRGTFGGLLTGTIYFLRQKNSIT